MLKTMNEKEYFQANFGVDNIADAHIQYMLNEQMQESGIEILDELKLKFIKGEISLLELTDTIWNKAYCLGRDEIMNKPKKDIVGDRFINDLHFLIDNIGYDIVKNDISINSQKEYHKRLKIMRDTLH